MSPSPESFLSYDLGKVRYVYVKYIYSLGFDYTVVQGYGDERPCFHGAFHSSVGEEVSKYINTEKSNCITNCHSLRGWYSGGASKYLLMA